MEYTSLYFGPSRFLNSSEILSDTAEHLRMTQESFGSMWSDLAEHAGESIIGLGEEQGRLASTVADGRTFLWTDDRAVQKSVIERGATFLPHPRCWASASVSFIPANGLAPIQLQSDLPEVTRCCWHRRLPLCAIGRVDGSVSVWRVPVEWHRLKRTEKRMRRIENRIVRRPHAFDFREQR
jgi:hypothetical protein